MSDVEARLRALESERRELVRALEVSRHRERVLAAELQHRVRNMLAVVRSIYRRTHESGASYDELAEHFQGRLDTIARYQSELIDRHSDGVSLENVVRDELLRVGASDGADLSIAGPPVRLARKTLEIVALAVHELVTNSIKFGALCHDGELDIGWSLHEGDERRLLRFRWWEAAVPTISLAPRPRGFGQEFIEEALPYQLGATTSFELKPGGLRCTIVLPMSDHEASVLVDAAGDEIPPFLPSESGGVQ